MATLVVKPTDPLPPLSEIQLPPKSAQVAAVQKAALDLRTPGAPNGWDAKPEELRAAMNGPVAEMQKGVECPFVEDLMVPVLDNGGLGKPTGIEIMCRLYRQTPKDGAKDGLVVYFHGSGFVILSVDTHDGVCRHISKLANCAVLSVEYRLAPENPFPACIDDCLSAVSYAYANAKALGIDATKIAVAGDSAGGNLAAVSALHSSKFPHPLSYQVLFYPCVDGRAEDGLYASYERGTPNAGLDKNLMQWFWGHYANGNDKARLDWRFSPLLADDAVFKANKVPAYVMAAGEFEFVSWLFEDFPCLSDREPNRNPSVASTGPWLSRLRSAVRRGHRVRSQAQGQRHHHSL